MFDITSQAVADTATIHLKNAAGELLYADRERTKPVRITIYGPSSLVAAAVEGRQSQRALQRYQDNDGKVSPASPEEALKETAEDWAARTVSFENLAYPPANGAQGPELYEAVYRDRSLGFIIPQLEKFYRNWGNFKTGSVDS